MVAPGGVNSGPVHVESRIVMERLWRETNSALTCVDKLPWVANNS